MFLDPASDGQSCLNSPIERNDDPGGPEGRKGRPGSFQIGPPVQGVKHDCIGETENLS
jgi:hypothetical protein